MRTQLVNHALTRLPVTVSCPRSGGQFAASTKIAYLAREPGVEVKLRLLDALDW